VGSPALLVMFLCNHCPYVKHVAEELVRLAREYQARGVGVVAISSNDVAKYPEDGPARMAEVAAAMGATFAYLYDETQDVAKAYHAACTPDFFLFKADGGLVYRGQLDGARPGNDVPVSGHDLRAALDAVLAGTPVPEPQRPSIGCSIKWKPGNEPAYVAPGHEAAGS
jgi:thiol-disulfide isomerase/thioredoxin